MKAKKISDAIIFVILCVLVVLFITPVYFVVMNSFKGKLYISDNPFALPTAETFSRLTNYINGILYFSAILFMALKREVKFFSVSIFSSRCAERRIYFPFSSPSFL